MMFKTAFLLLFFSYSSLDFMTSCSVEEETVILV